MFDVLNHAADDDVVDGEFIVFEGLEDYVVFLDLFLLTMHHHELTINVINIKVSIFIIVQLVEISCDNGLFNFVKALEIIMTILISVL